MGVASEAGKAWDDYAGAQVPFASGAEEAVDEDTCPLVGSI